MSFKVGDTFADYVVVDVLGAGGMGQVYKVRNTLSNRFEAMKVLLPGLLETGEMTERFLREIRVQASLDHPNIAALRTALRVENQVVMIMELVEGTTLQAMLERGPLPMKAAVGDMIQALSALSYAHDRGVIHRDIKPGNIMLTRDGIVKLTDFGIAKASVDRSRSVTGARMGSIYYMSPEQVQGSATLDARSDIYSLGVTLYETVTGSRPFEGENDYAILAAHCNVAPVPPQEKKPAIPPELNQAILKSLAKDPAARFQTAAEFREALQNIQGLPEEAPATKPIAIPEVPAAGTSRGTSLSQLAAQRPTGSKTSSSTTLEMAYVLFMDIVAYSTLPMDRQTERIQELVGIVRNTQEFRKAQESDQLISLPTGDGMALVFFQDPVAPVQCATEISRALHSHPEVKLRMGVHTGPVYRIPDINTNRNVAGGGINMAQRVMDCGDAGHILLSKTVADVLGQLSDWAGSLHDFGEAEVKHGVKVHIVNFCTGEVGNPELPQKLRKMVTVQPQAPPTSPRRNVYWVAAGGILAAAIIVYGATQLSHRREPQQERNLPPPAAQAPSQPSTPTPPPPPANTIPAAPPPGLTPPPQTPPASSSPSQTALVPVAKKPAEVPRQPSEQVVPVAPPQKTEPQPVRASPSTSAPASAAPAAPGPADRALLQEQRERMIFLASRAGAVRGSLENLERQQNRAGLSLRSDMAAAKQSVEYLMEEAKASLAAGDPAATKRNLDLAEQQVEKLEHFMGR